MNRGHRGSGCSRITAIVIIEASKGKSEPAWFATMRPRPWAGTFLTPVDVHPPPHLVEEPEQREHRLGEVLVESPLVLRVLAAQAPQDGLDGLADDLGKRADGIARGRHRIDSRLDARADLAEEAGERLGVLAGEPTLGRPSSSLIVQTPLGAPGQRPDEAEGRCVGRRGES